MTAGPPINRFSPLYCRYHGMMLGQYLMVAMAPSARRQWAVHRHEMQAILSDLGIDVELPEEPFEFGTEDHNALLKSVLLELNARSTHLGDMAVLGTHFITHGHLVDADPETAGEIRRDIVRIVDKQRLPHPKLEDFGGWNLDGDSRASIHTTLAPSFRYLAEGLQSLPREPQTALVVAPYGGPPSTDFEVAFRPAFTRAGYRVLRPWAGPMGEDRGALGIVLIRKCGLLVADVSDADADTHYQIGAAHAFGNRTVLLRRKGSSGAIPTAIEPTAVHTYDPAAKSFPWQTVDDLSIALAARAAREKKPSGAQTRIEFPSGADEHPPVLDDPGEDSITDIREHAIPEAARVARDRGLAALEAAELALAADELERSIELGLDDAPSRLALGFVQLMTGRLQNAANHYAMGIALADPPQIESALRALSNVRDALEGEAGAIADDTRDRMRAALSAP